jgi:hypothetical protein
VHVSLGDKEYKIVTGDKDEAFANAHLIAAAPDMYEALKAFKSAFENGVIKTNDLATELAVESAISLAEESMKKAKGE